MADMTALQRIIGGQARAHEALRREDQMRERERRSYVTQALLGEGIDPATIPGDQVDSVFQTILGQKVQEEEAVLQARKLKEKQDIARQLEDKERQAISDQKGMLSLLGGINHPEAAGMRTDLFGSLTGIYTDPSPPKEEDPDMKGLIDRFGNRPNIEAAFLGLGYSPEDIADQRSSMYNDELAKTEQKVSDWLATQFEMAGVSNPSANMSRTLARELIEQSKPPDQPAWYEIFTPEVPPNAVGSSFSGGPKPSSSGLSIRQSDYETGAASSAPELPETGEALINAVPPEVRPTAGVIAREAQTPLMTAVMMGIADQESGMGRYLVNKGSSARGLFQIMPNTFRAIASNDTSSLGAFKGLSNPEIMERLENDHALSARAARELLYLNMRSFPGNSWAGIAAHHLGVRDLKKAYKQAGLDPKTDHPMLLAEALASSSNSKYKEFAGWFPNVYKNILDYRNQVGAE